MLTTLILFALSVARAEKTAVSREILHLAITCENLGDAGTKDFVAEQLRRHNPGARITPVVMTWPCGTEDDRLKAAADQLVRNLEEALGTIEGSFDLIALDFPDLGTPGATLIAPLGHLSASGMDEDLQSALAPLRNRAKVDGKVLMTAGNSFGGEPAGNEVRAEHLLDFFGNTRGSLFGMETSRQAYEPLSWKKDVRLALLMGSVGSAFSFALWSQPDFGWKAIGLSFVYAWVVKTFHRAIGGTAPTEAPASQAGTHAYDKLEAVVSSLERLTPGEAMNNIIPSVLGDGLAAWQFMGAALVAPAFFKAYVTAVAITVPFTLITYPIVRRIPWFGKSLDGLINRGRTYQRKADGTFENRSESLVFTRQRIFGCESALVETPSEDGMPAADPAA